MSAFYTVLFVSLFNVCGQMLLLSGKHFELYTTCAPMVLVVVVVVVVVLPWYWTWLSNRADRGRAGR